MIFKCFPQALKSKIYRMFIKSGTIGKIKNMYYQNAAYSLNLYACKMFMQIVTPLKPIDL